jgi:very-short-patch-repair endonuclease
MRPHAKRLEARELRRDMTEAEQRLWFHLRRRQLGGCRFRRQHPVGPFVADFVCVERRLIVEVDGSQHMESAADRVRDAWLQRRGFQLIRCWNHDVLERTEQVLAVILGALGKAAPIRPPGTFPRKRGKD